MDSRQKEIIELIKKGAINISKLADMLGLSRATLNSKLYYNKKLDMETYIKIKQIIVANIAELKSGEFTAKEPFFDYMVPEMKKDKVISILLEKIEILEQKLSNCECESKKIME